ncbi:MAG: hypothetical protein HOY71_19625 [Nonomuraea sp.]|nr:hypothetical protein [Nonomuraea sp.]
MKYMLLIYVDEKAWRDATPDQRQAVYDAHVPIQAAVRERGTLVETRELGESAGALTLRAGQRTDGPFAETVEHLGGYYVIDVADLDAAIELATMLPEAAVEVRPVEEYPG